MSAAAASGSCDLAVIGGGILGLATAHELQRRHPGWKIVVLERDEALARHQTGRNSGVAHAGIYYAPGSLKARLCVEGLARLYEFCDEAGVPYERCGKVIVALSEEELPRLDELERRGRANGVPGLRRLDAAGLRELEPHAVGVAALHSPATGIVDFAAVARALADRLERDGATIVTGCAVSHLRSEAGGVRIEHTHGELRAGHAVACAGLWSDRLAVAAGGQRDPRIVPFRGGYLRLRPERRGLVRSLIYPVPDPALPFLGVHFTKRIDGDVLLGPTALLTGGLGWPGTWRMMRRFWRVGARELRLAADRRAFVAACARYVPELETGDVTGGPSGVRAQAVGRDGALIDDFVFDDAGGALHVRNAPSPGATSAFAIARLIADRAQSTRS